MIHSSRSSRAQALVVLLGIALGSCGGSSSGSGSGGAPAPDVGQLQQDPQGRWFFVDAHGDGRARALHLVESAWARLVDVHDVDALGEPSVEPLMRDVPVRPDLTTDAERVLGPGTLGRTRLVVLHARGTSAFEAALRDATEDLPVIVPRHDDGATAGPFSLVARNAAIVLRFDDLLSADADARLGLVESVRVRAGYGDRTPFRARIVFDESHGDVVGGAFHPTRVVIDPTISADEDGDPLALNPIGLPASLTTTEQPNVSLRLGTVPDPGAGLFHVLENLRGRGLDPLENGPADSGVPTVDVVRAVRAGNGEDPSNGFLLDEVAPVVIGRFPAAVHAAEADPGEAGAFVLTLAFRTSCAKALAAGEVVDSAGGALVVTQASAEPDGDGVITGVHARSAGSETPDADELLGLAHLLTSLAPGSAVAPGCFVEVAGVDAREPGAPIQPGAQFRVRFSEPMEPASFDALESLRLFAGDAPTATSTVVATALASADATSAELAPLVPLAHAAGASEGYVLELVGGAEGVTDLAGNALATALAPLELVLDAAAPAIDSGGVSLRFASGDEYDPDGSGGADLRGTFTYDFTHGVLRPRPVQRRSWPIDGSTPVTAKMLALTVGIREPLVALGSRLQTLWRYVDAGWNVADETLYDLDVEGVAWAPFGGNVIGDFFEEFELCLAHAVQLPDEGIGAPGVLGAPMSGLLDAPTPFDGNALEPGGARPVNLRGLGYRIASSALFQSTSGTRMLPLPIAEGVVEPFTWRDTSLQGKGGAGGLGIPLLVEQNLDPSVVPGSIAGSGEVPSFGLPLLMEVRTFPFPSAIGLNGFQVAIAQPGQLFPSFRVHSSGGLDQAGVARRIDPDLEPIPSGSFDPFSLPPGQPTRSADPAVYFGQLDTVTRVSRVHTGWLDAGNTDPDWLDPLVAPAAALQPTGTAVILEFRGATGFLDTNGAEHDAQRIDPYGELAEGVALYPDDDRSWTRDIDDCDGLRHLQVRITFENDVESGLSPELDSLALAFLRR